ncbi:neuropeptide-like protein 31 [Periplaneta americana]|uniref:neuropeptide-like protein 31 n=1 Tax=Periplaneta americana TaxID=6978 RepID=UPI0037E991C0
MNRFMGVLLLGVVAIFALAQALPAGEQAAAATVDAPQDESLGTAESAWGWGGYGRGGWGGGYGRGWGGYGGWGGRGWGGGYGGWGGRGWGGGYGGWGGRWGGGYWG